MNNFTVINNFSQRLGICTYGNEIAWSKCVALSPAYLLQKKWVTPVFNECWVFLSCWFLVVATHLPWSTEISAITELGCMFLTISSLITWGAFAPVTKTAPITKIGWCDFWQQFLHNDKGTLRGPFHHFSQTVCLYRKQHIRTTFGSQRRRISTGSTCIYNFFLSVEVNYQQNTFPPDGWCQ